MSGKAPKTAIDDLRVVKFTPKRPSGHTSPSAPDPDEQKPRPAYPLTNGNAGGKLPAGKRGSGSPLWSFSAAVR